MIPVKKYKLNAPNITELAMLAINASLLIQAVVTNNIETPNNGKVICANFGKNSLIERYFEANKALNPTANSKNVESNNWFWTNPSIPIKGKSPSAKKNATVRVATAAEK